MARWTRWLGATLLLLLLVQELHCQEDASTVSSHTTKTVRRRLRKFRRQQTQQNSASDGAGNEVHYQRSRVASSGSSSGSSANAPPFIPGRGSRRVYTSRRAFTSSSSSSSPSQQQTYQQQREAYQQQQQREAYQQQQLQREAYQQQQEQYRRRLEEQERLAEIQQQQHLGGNVSRPPVLEGSYLHEVGVDPTEQRRLFSWNGRQRADGGYRRRYQSSYYYSQGQGQGGGGAVTQTAGYTGQQAGQTGSSRQAGGARYRGQGSRGQTGSRGQAGSGYTYQYSRRQNGNVVTRYPGRTVYRNLTGTYVTQTTTLPDGGTVTTYNYTAARRPGVVSSRDRTVIRNRTVVTTTSRGVSGTSTGGGSVIDTRRYPPYQPATQAPPSSSSVFRNVTTYYRNESRVVSSGGRGPQGSKFEYVGVQTSGGRGGGRRTSGSSRETVTSSSGSRVTSSGSRVTSSTRGTSSGSRRRTGGRTTSRVTRVRVTEERISQEELRRAYIEKNRLQQFGECVCNMLGTDASAGPCDPSSGQCHCLPNVMGPQCDRCVPNHWKIAIGDGCEPCACDPVGSLEEQCNEYDGQCRCRPGFGGRRCDQCQDKHWGNPRLECFPCECNPYGSADLQCDRDTGLCPCKPGMGGDKCDQCARGYKGRAPYCDPCGECFDNWDRILTELRERTEYLVSEAGKIKQGGAAGAYQREFEQMEAWLDGVRQILGNGTVTDDQVDRLQGVIDEVRTNLTESDTLLKTIELSVDNTTNRVLLAELQVPNLRGRADSLRSVALTLRENATVLQEANVDGALSLTREAQKRSQAAEVRVQDNERVLSESERQRRRTENLLNQAGQRFNQSQSDTQLLIDEVNNKLLTFEREIPAINDQVCDGAGDPCDALCGGAGCGRCGGLSCDEGAVTRASNALSVAQDAARILEDRERQVDDLLRSVTMAKRAADEAHSLARMALTGAELNNNRTLETSRRVSELLVQIEEFLGEDGASARAIRQMAEDVLALSISLRPEQITELARQINQTISSLTNIQAILDATADDLATATGLERRADAAKLAAEKILETAGSVITALELAATAQVTAANAMESASTNIQLAGADLQSIASEADAAMAQANASLTEVIVLRRRQKEISREFSKNELDVRGAAAEAEQAALLAGRAEQGVERLETAYEEAVELLRSRAESSASARERAQRLLTRANLLASTATDQIGELEVITREFTEHETVLTDLSDEVMELNRQMDSYLQSITERAEHYRTCQS